MLHPLPMQTQPQAYVLAQLPSSEQSFPCGTITSNSADQGLDPSAAVLCSCLTHMFYPLFLKNRDHESHLYNILTWMKYCHAKTFGASLINLLWSQLSLFFAEVVCIWSVPQSCNSASWKMRNSVLVALQGLLYVLCSTTDRSTAAGAAASAVFQGNGLQILKVPPWQIPVSAIAQHWSMPGTSGLCAQ